MVRPLPSSTLVPYTTLFRSIRCRRKDVLNRELYGDDVGKTLHGITDLAVHSERVQFDPGKALSTLERAIDQHRSEEHTSELQSRLHLVCRLLLEKKKFFAYM